jgi:DNA polymerase III alpha subunit
MWYDNYIDSNGEIILDDKAVFNLLYEGADLNNVKCTRSKDLEIYNNIIDEYDLNISKLQFVSSTDDKKEFIQKCLNNWFLPEKYTHMDPYDYIRNLTKTQQENDRVELEIQMFEERNMKNVLRFMIFFINFMRENNIVWGVGRGSSVASYCLYLLGVHKVNSLHHDLDIKEFLK